MREPTTPRQIEIDKHWYQWMLWGRLGYDPELSNDRFTSILQARFPQSNASKLFKAWQEASMIYPKTTGFHWGALDFIWYIESSQSRPFMANTPTGFHDVNRFITMGTHGGTDYISIPKFVEAQTKGNQLTGTTPFQIAEQIHNHSDTALAQLDELSLTGNKELRQTIDDIRTIAWLGKYYAHKIEAATQLALYRKINDKTLLNACVENLNESATYWRSYTSLALSNYKNPLWTNRVGHVDWKKNYQAALYDIRAVGGSLNLPSMEPSKGGSVLEAEDAKADSLDKRDNLPGHTGSGYVYHNRNSKDPSITWTYEADAPGRHILELRYNNPWDRAHECTFHINGATYTINIWETGKGDNWVWDHIIVDLKNGTNKIHLKGRGQFYVDHLNVIPLGEK